MLDPDVLMPNRLCKCALLANEPTLAVPAALGAPFATAALKPCLLTGMDVFTMSETLVLLLPCLC